MEFYSLSFDKVILRYYLMMVIIIGSFFIGYPALAVLSVPVFLSVMAGVSFKSNKKKVSKPKVGVETAMYSKRSAA